MHVSRNKVIYVGRDMKVARKIPLTLRYVLHRACNLRGYARGVHNSCVLNYPDILRAQK